MVFFFLFSFIRLYLIGLNLFIDGGRLNSIIIYSRNKRMELNGGNYKIFKCISLKSVLVVISGIKWENGWIIGVTLNGYFWLVNIKVLVVFAPFPNLVVLNSNTTNQDDIILPNNTIVCKSRDLKTPGWNVQSDQSCTKRFYCLVV